MKFRKYLIGYDTYERHRMVAKLVEKETKSILDVGGREGVLAQFIGMPVVVVNLKEGDIRANGLRLPFADSTIDTVTSLDVLEHIPPDQRCAFLKELWRICHKQVLICAPFGSAEHMISEKQLLDKIQCEGSSSLMLAQHVENGLPTLETFTSCLSKSIKIKTWFSGYYRYNSFCFRIDHLFGPNNFKWVKVILGIFLNLFGNLIIFPLSLTRYPRAGANRMFVILHKL